MNVVDSSAWLDFFTDNVLAPVFKPIIEDWGNLIVPTVTLYEVKKKTLLERGAKAAEEAIDLMRDGSIVPCDEQIALRACEISLQYKLPMADSIIYATALVHNAIVWSSRFRFQRFAECPLLREEPAITRERKDNLETLMYAWSETSETLPSQ